MFQAAGGCPKAAGEIYGYSCFKNISPIKPLLAGYDYVTIVRLPTVRASQNYIVVSNSYLFDESDLWPLIALAFG